MRLNVPSGKPSEPGKKPFYKKWWFITIVAVLVIGGLGNAMGAGGKSGVSPTLAPVATSTSTPTVEATAEATEAPSEAPAAKPEPTAPSATGAMVACENYGRAQFPYFKLPASGRLVEEASEGEFYMKYRVTLKNASGQKIEADMECTVVGYGDYNLTVTEFLVY